jgi:predicted exporter
MSDINFESVFEGLTPEQAKARAEKIRQAIQGVVQAEQAEGQSAAMAAVRGQYEAERNKIVQQTRPGEQRIRAMAELKTKYRARGLGV